DLFVTAGSAVTSGGAALTMPEKLGADLARIDGVEVVLPIRYYQTQFRKDIVFVVAIDLDAFASRGQDRPLARSLAEKSRELTGSGKVLVSDNFAALHKVKKGDRLKVDG